MRLRETHTHSNGASERWSEGCSRNLEWSVRHYLLLPAGTWSHGSLGQPPLLVACTDPNQPTEDETNREGHARNGLSRSTNQPIIPRSNSAWGNLAVAPFITHQSVGRANGNLSTTGLGHVGQIRGRHLDVGRRTAAPSKLRTVDAPDALMIGTRSSVEWGAVMAIENSIHSRARTIARPLV